MNEFEYDLEDNKPENITVVDEVKCSVFPNNGQPYIEYISYDRELVPFNYSASANVMPCEQVQRAKVIEKVICRFEEKPGKRPTKIYDRYKFAVKREVLDVFNIPFDLIELYENESNYLSRENYDLSKRLDFYETLGFWGRLKFLFKQ